MIAIFVPRPALPTEISPSSPAMPCRAWPLWRMTESYFTDKMMLMPMPMPGRREQLVTAKHRDRASGLIPSVGERKPVLVASQYNTSVRESNAVQVAGPYLD